MRLFFLSLGMGLALTACNIQKPVVSNEAYALAVPPTTSESTAASSREIDFVVVQKSQRILALWSHGHLIKTYPIMAMGANPVGKKMYEGDERTPEGQYIIDDKHISEHFQKFLNISYPNDEDRLLARRLGVPAGGHVGIHGDRGGVSGFFQRLDKRWTDGCIAMRNADIEDIYDRVAVGTPILIKP